MKEGDRRVSAKERVGDRRPELGRSCERDRDTKRAIVISHSQAALREGRRPGRIRWLWVFPAAPHPPAGWCSTLRHTPPPIPPLPHPLHHSSEACGCLHLSPLDSDLSLTPNTDLMGQRNDTRHQKSHTVHHSYMSFISYSTYSITTSSPFFKSVYSILLSHLLYVRIFIFYYFLFLLHFRGGSCK